MLDDEWRQIKFCPVQVETWERLADGEIQHKRKEQVWENLGGVVDKIFRCNFIFRGGAWGISNLALLPVCRSTSTFYFKVLEMMMMMMMVMMMMMMMMMVNLVEILMCYYDRIGFLVMVTKFIAHYLLLCCFGNFMQYFL